MAAAAAKPALSDEAEGIAHVKLAIFRLGDILKSRPASFGGPSFFGRRCDDSLEDAGHQGAQHVEAAIGDHLSARPNDVIDQVIASMTGNGQGAPNGGAVAPHQEES